MTARDLSCADTATLIRQSLAESFKGLPFSVRTQTYGGSVTFYVSWTDGPNAAQVEAITSRVGRVYFDGPNDDAAAGDQRLDDYEVCCGVDHVFTVREHSDAAVQSAIDRIYRCHENLLPGNGLFKPTVDQFRSRELSGLQLAEFVLDTGNTVQTMIHQALAKQSDRLKVACEKPALRAFVTLRDGYVRECGEQRFVMPLYDRFGPID
jgi:hypothetical protein